MPHQQDNSADDRVASVAGDWQRLLSRAGFSISDLRETKSRLTPPVYADERAAWQGVYPDFPDISVRLEAASLDGAPVFFQTDPTDAPKDSFSDPEVAPLWSDTIRPFLLVVAVTAGAWLAWQNWRLGRANQRGAARLALILVASEMLAWLGVAHHSFSFNEEFYSLLVPMLGHAAQTAFFTWLMYLAFEPYLRRRWPWRIVGWNRLLDGRWRDPLVGRDILIGAAAGLSTQLVVRLAYLSSDWLKLPPPEPSNVFADVFFTRPLATVVGVPNYVMQAAVLFLFLLLIFLAVLRRESFAAVAFFLVLMTLGYFRKDRSDIAETGGYLGIGLIIGVITWILSMNLLMLLRFGLLAFASYLLFDTLIALPLTTDIHVWYFGATMIYAVFFAGIALYAFFISLGNRPLLSPTWLADD